MPGAAPPPKNQPGHLPGLGPDDGPDDEPMAETGFTVEVIRSTRRTRTVGAEMRGDVLRVTVPSWMSTAEEATWVAKMSASFRRRRSSDRIDLTRRAATLADRYDLRRPNEIRWATDMTTRWGSCTPATGIVRISDRLAAYPDWVVDYVIVHELGHLSVRGHGPSFWRLVRRYPKTERAIGYLLAKSSDDTDLPED
jgi:predicted metal-dependent hydrolase